MRGLAAVARSELRQRINSTVRTGRSPWTKVFRTELTVLSTEATREPRLSGAGRAVLCLHQTEGTWEQMETQILGKEQGASGKVNICSMQKTRGFFFLVLFCSLPLLFIFFIKLSLLKIITLSWGIYDTCRGITYNNSNLKDESGYRAPKWQISIFHVKSTSLTVSGLQKAKDACCNLSRKHCKNNTRKNSKTAKRKIKIKWNSIKYSNNFKRQERRNRTKHQRAQVEN